MRRCEESTGVAGNMVVSLDVKLRSTRFKPLLRSSAAPLPEFTSGSMRWVMSLARAFCWTPYTPHVELLPQSFGSLINSDVPQRLTAGNIENGGTQEILETCPQGPEL